LGQRGCNQEGDESDKGCVTIQGHNAVGSVAGWWPPLRLLNTDRRGPTGGCQRMRARWTYLSSRLGVWRIPVCDKHQTAIRCAREGVLSRIGAPGAFGACACTEGCPRRREDTPDWPLMKRVGAKTKTETRGCPHVSADIPRLQPGRYGTDAVESTRIGALRSRARYRSAAVAKAPDAVIDSRCVPWATM